MFLEVHRFETVWLNLLLALDDLFDFVFDDLIMSPLGIAFISCILFVIVGFVLSKLLKVVLNN